jgi:hypothetical protein
MAEPLVLGPSCLEVEIATAKLKKYKSPGSDEIPTVFIEFKKAYDSVRKEVLYNILIDFGVPLKLVR